MLGPGFNPVAKEFSENQKKMLKEIHKKYGAFGRSSLLYEIEPGDQTINLQLN